MIPFKLINKLEGISTQSFITTKKNAKEKDNQLIMYSKAIPADL